MKKIIFVLMVLCISIFGCVNSTNQHSEVLQEKQAEFINHLRNSTAMLTMEVNDHYRSFCSGVWISKNKILTAFHCVDDEKSPPADLIGTKILISNFSELEQGEVATVHNAKVISVSFGNDLALLEVKEKTVHDFVGIHTGKIYPGMNVHIVGHPVGFLYTYIPGIVSGSRMIELPSGEYGKITQITSAIFYGNSGGGAFDGEGNLLGIASFITRAPLMSFFVDISNIKVFLEQADSN